MCSSVKEPLVIRHTDNYISSFLLAPSSFTFVGISYDEWMNSKESGGGGGGGECEMKIKMTTDETTNILISHFDASSKTIQ